MSKDAKVILRAADGSGLIVNRADVKAAMDANPGKYTEESPEQTRANQDTADAGVEAKARAKSEDKAVAAPTRNRG